MRPRFNTYHIGTQELVAAGPGDYVDGDGVGAADQRAGGDAALVDVAPAAVRAAGHAAAVDCGGRRRRGARVGVHRGLRPPTRERECGGDAQCCRRRYRAR